MFPFLSRRSGKAPLDTEKCTASLIPGSFDEMHEAKNMDVLLPLGERLAEKNSELSCTFVAGSFAQHRQMVCGRIPRLVKAGCGQISETTQVSAVCECANSAHT